MKRAYSQLLDVWSQADPGLKWLVRATVAAEQAGLGPVPSDVSPTSQHRYDPSKLTSVGPNEWRPNPAPRPEAIYSEKKKVARRNSEHYSDRLLAAPDHSGGMRQLLHRQMPSSETCVLRRFLQV